MISEIVLCFSYDKATFVKHCFGCHGFTAADNAKRLYRAYIERGFLFHWLSFVPLKGKRIYHGNISFKPLDLFRIMHSSYYGCIFDIQKPKSVKRSVQLDLFAQPREASVTDDRRR